MVSIRIAARRRDKQYDILIGNAAFASWLENRRGIGTNDRIVFLVDANVAALYDFPASLPAESRQDTLLVEPGETRKNLGQYAELIDELLALGVDRKTVLVAVGGGVTGDIAGFVAATLLRGVRCVQIPTTLLAQVDSSVGGKTGVNAGSGKNLIGAFHQPECVVVDTAFLDTLPEREYLAGLAEVVKYGILGDAEFFDSLAGSGDKLATRDRSLLAGVVERCCRMKAEIVARDETERGDRALLNLGHTFGHVLEAMAGYDGTVVHGEAVAVGTTLACDFAVSEGMFRPQESDRVRACLKTLGLPTAIADLSAGTTDWKTSLTRENLTRTLLLDKKTAGNLLSLILPVRIGECRICANIPADKVADFILSQSGLSKEIEPTAARFPLKF